MNKRNTTSGRLLLTIGMIGQDFPQDPFRLNLPSAGLLEALIPTCAHSAILLLAYPSYWLFAGVKIGIIGRPTRSSGHPLLPDASLQMDALKTEDHFLQLPSA